MYVDALRALIADRHDILTGQDNELIKHEYVFYLKHSTSRRLQCSDL